MVLGKLPVPGRPTYLDYSRARACCACNRCGRGLFGHFFSICHISFLSPSLWETARYRLKYCLKGPLSPKQPASQLVIVNLLILKSLLYKKKSILRVQLKVNCSEHFRCFFFLCMKLNILFKKNAQLCTEK